MTTYRTLLDEQCRAAMRQILGGFAIFVGSALLAGALDAPPLLCVGLVGFAIFGYGIVRVQFFGTIRCPACSGNLGLTWMSRGPLPSFPSNVKFCSLCGTSIDKEAEELSPEAKSDIPVDTAAR
jgi:hypothetical protein